MERPGGSNASGRRGYQREERGARGQLRGAAHAEQRRRAIARAQRGEVRGGAPARGARGVEDLRAETTRVEVAPITRRAQVEKDSDARGVYAVHEHDTMGVARSNRVRSRRGDDAVAQIARRVLGVGERDAAGVREREEGGAEGFRLVPQARPVRGRGDVWRVARRRERKGARREETRAHEARARDAPPRDRVEGVASGVHRRASPAGARPRRVARPSA
eukprot:31366-Pelagococcus_subviridis.AAC.15